MKRTTLTAIAASVGVAFAACAAAETMSKTHYNASKEAIESEYKSASAACEPLKANARDICMAEAKGKERVARAELAAAYKPTATSHYTVRMAHAEADYSVAREKCDDQQGNAKDVCVKEAKAARVAGEADAKAQRKTVAAKHDASVDKRDAEYAVAKEKCAALEQPAKDTCIADAKAQFGKS
jgi:hypothetical protein